MSTASTPDTSLLREAQTLAVSLAEQAGEIQLAAVRAGYTIHHKGTVDLVTDADIASETLISAGIRAAYPDHRITAEEGAEGNDQSDYRWLIDPIDGTTNFAHGFPHWAVSICLEHNGKPVMGVVYDVAKNEMFTAITERGACLNGETIEVSAIDTLMQAMGATGFAYDIHARTPAFRLWEAANNNAQAMRRAGAAALDMVWVACGRLDFYFEQPVNNWDVSAGAIICQEAGGTVTAFNGDPYNIDDIQICASNSLLHGQMLQLIRETEQPHAENGAE